MIEIRNYTEEEAIEGGMHYSKMRHCPECGCPWFGNMNMCGEGHRVCCDCYQDWWTHIKYSDSAERRELPLNIINSLKEPKHNSIGEEDEEL